MKIEICNLTKTYGKNRALNNLSFTLEDGVYGLLGPNGAGKSTLINLLTTNLKREEGAILCDGKEIIQMGEEYRSLVGYMPQEQCLYPNYSAIEFLRYIASVKGLKRKEAEPQIQELLEAVNLWKVRNKKAGGFSGGMKQRLMLAQALLGDPKFLILDEPTAGLDPNERIHIRNYIAELSSNRVVLFATHVVSDIEAIADTIILMNKGKLVRFADAGTLISEIDGKVGEIICSKEEIIPLQDKYHTGNVARTRNGLTLRIVGDKLPEEAQSVSDKIGLEDVFLYQIGKLSMDSEKTPE